MGKFHGLHLKDFPFRFCYQENLDGDVLGNSSVAVPFETATRSLAGTAPSSTSLVMLATGSGNGETRTATEVGEIARANCWLGSGRFRAAIA